VIGRFHGFFERAPLLRVLIYSLLFIWVVSALIYWDVGDVSLVMAFLKLGLVFGLAIVVAIIFGFVGPAAVAGGVGGGDGGDVDSSD